MTLVIDIDETIIFSKVVETCKECGSPIYRQEKIDFEEVERINQAYEKGNIIIFYTGRDWIHFEHTKKQLDSIPVKYHRLIMGKPIGVYVDKEAVKSLKELVL